LLSFQELFGTNDFELYHFENFSVFGSKLKLTISIILCSQTTTVPPVDPNVPAPDQIAQGLRLHLIALNRPLSGKLRGIRGIDYECYKEARLSGLRGTYRGFISSSTQDLKSIIHYSRDRQLPIVNKEGQILFDSWDKMVDGSGAFFNSNTPIYSFSGKNILTDRRWPQKYIWHGSSRTGSMKEGRSCDKWHSKSPNYMGRASSLSNAKLLEEGDYTCDNSFAVLCIENTAQRGNN
jgi:collagen type XVIII alpha